MSSKTIRYSLAEIEATSRKAARGWGFDWGVAEDIGKATRHLSSLGFPAVDMLAQLLQSNETRTYEDFRPHTELTPWQASDGLLCPMVTGIALSDQSFRFANGQNLELGPIAYPALLVYFVVQASQQTLQCLSLQYGENTIYCHGDVIGAKQALEFPVQAPSVVISVTEWPTGITHLNTSPDSQPVANTSWQVLEQYAFNMYAPSTEQSRAGAGSDTSDQIE